MRKAILFFVLFAISFSASNDRCLSSETLQQNQPQKEPWIFTDTSDEVIDLHDLVSSEGEALRKLVGRKITVRGKLVDWGKGSSGLIDENMKVGIIFEPIEIPKNGELTVKYTVTRYRENPNDFAARVDERGGKWFSKITSPKRKKKLQQLLAAVKLHEYITASGTLCHFKMITAGKYALYPQVPSSHFFFSTDDLSLGKDCPGAPFIWKSELKAKNFSDNVENY